MVKTRRRFVLPAFIAALALVLLLSLRPLATERSLAIWLILVAGLVLLTLARDVRARDATGRKRRFEAALRGRPPRSAVPVELLRVERELELGIASAGHAYRRLLPLLRAAASARLATGHGIELARSPERARALLGEDVWELLRPDRPVPADRHGPGIPRAAVAAAIAKVESL